jgi:hypothetical protein
MGAFGQSGRQRLGHHIKDLKDCDERFLRMIGRDSALAKLRQFLMVLTDISAGVDRSAPASPVMDLE